MSTLSEPGARGDGVLTGLLDDSIVDRLRALTGDDSSPVAIESLTGGRSNLTVRVGIAGRDFVVRRPPSDAATRGNHDMRREFEVLRALAGTDIPVPHVHLFEAGDGGDMPHLVMDLVEGRVLRASSAAPDMRDATRLALLGGTLVDLLARVHAVSPGDVGLEQFGRYEGFIDRQVRRWTTQWRSSATRSVPELDEVARRLEDVMRRGSVAHVPERPYLVHGDFNLANMMVAPADQFGPDDVIRAVLDWEMATLGHPLLDLATTLAYSGPLGDAILEVGPLVSSNPGFPSRNDLVQRYAETTGTDVDELAFYEVVASFKIVVLTEDVRHRMSATGARSDDLVGANTAELAAAMLEIADGSGISGLGSSRRRQQPRTEGTR